MVILHFNFFLILPYNDLRCSYPCVILGYILDDHFIVCSTVLNF